MGAIEVDPVLQFQAVFLHVPAQVPPVGGAPAQGYRREFTKETVDDEGQVGMQQPQLLGGSLLMVSQYLIYIP
jgi:hypothetical protein